MKVAVIGAGSWGTAVAALAAKNVETTLWARSEELSAAMQRDSRNDSYLPGIDLPEMTFTSDLEEACSGADIVAIGVPSHGFRAVLASAAGWIDSSATVISLVKGVEQGSLLRMTEVAHEVLTTGDQTHDHSHDISAIGVLTGPNLAREVAEGQPAASVVAIPDGGRAEQVQAAFMSATFRVYTNPDVVGCEIAGALKNVMAIAAGVAHGLGYGDNTIAALITRGLAELARLGIALGGSPLTFSGLAGMGDLVATCISDKSRNRTVGVELGRGRSLEDVVNEMHMVAEGVKTTRAVLDLAALHSLEMPIAEQVGAVLYDGRRPDEIVPALMMRGATSEMHGLG
ncbi:MAG: NAD(P)H-dependent glycerol-3-phosphate dehydrogenase [Actinomycetes bacterium]